MLTDNLDGFLLSQDDITICRNTEGKKISLGEGGFGVVYKGMMNGVDEVAVKVVKVGGWELHCSSDGSLSVSIECVAALMWFYAGHMVLQSGWCSMQHVHLLLLGHHDSSSCNSMNI